MDIDWVKISSMLAPFAGLLFIGNIYFVTRLITKIDRLERIVTERIPVQDTELENMASQMKSLKEEINQLSRDFKDVLRIRERIAVLEDRLKVRAK